MFNPSNVLSLFRAPLAFLFLIDRPDVRALVIISAMLTDCVDGYLARKYKFTSRFGAILDPLMDRFFVLFVLTILFYENTIQGWEMAAMLTRDLSILIFALYLLARGWWRGYNYRSLIWGKVTTALQFFVLLFLALNIKIAGIFFVLFFLFGFLVLGELFFTLKSNPEKV